MGGSCSLFACQAARLGLRVGILGDDDTGDLADYVLRKLPPLQRRQLAEMTDEAADAVEMWMKEGVAATADRFNGRRKFDSESSSRD